MVNYTVMFFNLLLALRSRFVSLSSFFLLILILVCVCAAQFSGRQPATVAYDVGLSFIRLALPLVVVVLVQQLLSNEFDRRYFLYSLSFPAFRHAWFLGRFFAGVLFVFGLLVLMALLLVFTVWLISKGYPQSTEVSFGIPALVTFSFLGLDLLVLSALACFLAVVASTPSFVLVGTLGFMLIARSYAAIIQLLSSSSGLVADAASYRGGLGMLGYFLPDLGSLDIRSVALYGKLELLPFDWPLLVISNSIYVVVLLAMAVWVLQRKRFS